MNESVYVCKNCGHLKYKTRPCNTCKLLEGYKDAA